MERTHNVPEIPRHRQERRRYTRLTLTLLSGLAVLLAACGRADDDAAAAAQQQAMPPVPVTVTTITPRDVNVIGEYAGRVHAVREVEVRARVGGILEQRLYTEGSAVITGDALFRIDAEPYRIALQRAQAELADARATLARAERERRRMEELFERGSVSERDRDDAVSQQELAEARLALSEAVVADAERNLRYTQVRAPVGGFTGLESLSEGSLVDVGTLLTTITQVDPVYVRFALPEVDARRQRAATGNGSAGVTLTLSDGSTFDHEGSLDFTDSRVDMRTGTITARAEFPNPDAALIPGQFVRIQVPLEHLGQAVVIPSAAIGQGPEGPRVFVIDDSDVARSRAVTIGPVVEGGQLIRAGLEAGDRVVINGQVALADGAPVMARPDGPADAAE
jgi:membrane fusion protein, multidrug efflux system